MVSLDIESIGPQLRKIRISQLDPALLDNVLELAADHGFEFTFASSGDLDFLFRIYQAEKVKNKRGNKELKRAENLILTLAGLYFGAEARAGGERTRSEEKRQKPRFDILESELSLSRRVKELFESIGISDEKDMKNAVGLLGEGKVEERIGQVRRCALGDSLARKVFAENPETLSIVRDDDFAEELSAMENKKSMIDSYAASGRGQVPLWADYNQSPNILLVEYKNIYRALGMEGVELDAGPEKEEHLRKMLREFGLRLQQDGNRMLIRGADGKVLVIPEPGMAEDAGPQSIQEGARFDWRVGGEEVSDGEQASTGRILRMIESSILNAAMTGRESDVIVVTGDKRRLNQINQLFGRDIGDHALAAYREIFSRAVRQAAGQGTPHLIRPSMSGDEAIGIIVVKKGTGAAVRSRLQECMEEATETVFGAVAGHDHPLSGAAGMLRRPRDVVEATIDISEPVLVRRIEKGGRSGACAVRADGTDAMILRPDGRREFLAAQVRTTDEQGSASHAPELRRLLNSPTSPQIEYRTAAMGEGERAGGVAFELKLAVEEEAALSRMREALPHTRKGLYEVARNSFGIRGLNTFLGHYGANGLIQRIEDAVGDYARERALEIRRVGSLKYVIVSAGPEEARGLQAFVDGRLREEGILLRTIIRPKAVEGLRPEQIEGEIANGHLGLDWTSGDYERANAAISAMAIGNDGMLGRRRMADLAEVIRFVRAHPEIRNCLDLFTAFRTESISGPSGMGMEGAFSSYIVSQRGA